MRSSSSNSLTFQNQKGDRFELNSKIVAQLLDYKQDAPDKTEVGGVLLGRFILNCNDVVVDRITVPMQGDKSSRFHFFRAARLHQQVIDEVWHLSKRTCNYLGEWHTHPEPDPSPSWIDRLGWRKKLLFDRFDSEVLYFVIVGTEKINVWQGYRGSLAIEQLCQLHRVY